MPEKTITYEEAQAKIKRLYKSRKITQKQYFKFSGQLKARYHGAPVTIKAKKVETVDEALTFFGEPLEELQQIS